MKTSFNISGKKYILKYERKMPEKEVIKMKSFVTNKGTKLTKTAKFKIKKVPSFFNQPLIVSRKLLLK